jgi:hypothetical protein
VRAGSVASRVAKCAARRLSAPEFVRDSATHESKASIIGPAAAAPRRHAREFSTASQRRPARAWEARARPFDARATLRAKKRYPHPAGRPVAARRSSGLLPENVPRFHEWADA